MIRVWAGAYLTWGLAVVYLTVEVAWIAQVKWVARFEKLHRPSPLG